MNPINPIVVMHLLAIMLIFTGCNRNPNTMWEDTKSAGRYMNRGFNSLGGKHGDSRQVYSRDEFMGPEYDDVNYQQTENNQAVNDYVPLSDDPNVPDMSMSDVVSRPPRETPGDPGSSIPGIQAFKDPSTNPRLANIFRNITFPYNGSLIKGDDNLQTIHNVAEYLKSHSNTYVFVEGHCDERGPEAYNLALGSHRSNAVRNMLIDDGVNPDNIFTISYGKERPVIMGHDEESWQQNRRAEFKVFER